MSNDYYAFLDQKADQYGIPRDYARAVMRQESGGNPSAVSPAGAVGLMQLMPGTARELGVDPRDPYQNMEGGLRYLAKNAEKYGLTGALAAYNGGPGRWEKSGGDLSLMPAETQNYVKSITGNLGGGMRYNNYGYDGQVGNIHNEQVSPEVMRELAAQKEMRALMLPLALGASMSSNEGFQNMGGRMLPFAMESLTPTQLKNGMVTPGGQYVSDVDTALDVAMAKGGMTQGKTLPFGAIEKLQGKADTADILGGLAGEFKPEYAGLTPSSSLSGLENWVGRNIGMAPQGLQDQANWWQRYNEQANKIRNELFGSALTAPELAAFKAANIEPGMSGEMIKRRLDQQAQAAQQAYRKIVGSVGGNGYNTSGLESMGGMAPQVGNAPSTATGNRTGDLTDEQILKQYGLR
jgi:hypothetical protein